MRHIAKLIKHSGGRREYPVSSQQKRLYAIQQTDETGVAYNMPSAYRISGRVEPQKMREALRVSMGAYSNLRTLYIMEQGEVRQRILSEFEPALEVEECLGLKLEEAVEGFVRPFDLERQCPIRARLRRLGEEEWVLQIDMHHIAADGGCYTQLISGFFSAYQRQALPEEQVRYVDYAVWQVEGEGVQEFAKHKQYWLEQYREELPVLELPIDHTRPAIRNYKGSTVSFTLPGEVSGALRQLARREQATLHMVLLSLWQVLLARLGGVEDLSVGVPASGRDRS